MNNALMSSSLFLPERTSRFRNAKSDSNDARPRPPLLARKLQPDPTPLLQPLHRNLEPPKLPVLDELFPSQLRAIHPLALALQPRLQNIKRNSPMLSPSSILMSARRSRRSIPNVSLVAQTRRSKRCCRNDTKESKPTCRRREEQLLGLRVSWEGRAGRKKGGGRKRSESRPSRRVRSRRRSNTRFSDIPSTLVPCSRHLLLYLSFIFDVPVSIKTELSLHFR